MPPTTAAEKAFLSSPVAKVSGASTVTLREAAFVRKMLATSWDLHNAKNVVNAPYHRIFEDDHRIYYVCTMEAAVDFSAHYRTFCRDHKLRPKNHYLENESWILAEGIDVIVNAAGSSKDWLVSKLKEEALNAVALAMQKSPKKNIASNTYLPGFGYKKNSTRVSEQARVSGGVVQGLLKDISNGEEIDNDGMLFRRGTESSGAFVGSYEPKRQSQEDSCKEGNSPGKEQRPDERASFKTAMMTDIKKGSEPIYPAIASQYSNASSISSHSNVHLPIDLEAYFFDLERNYTSHGTLTQAVKIAGKDSDPEELNKVGINVVEDFYRRKLRRPRPAELLSQLATRDGLGVSGGKSPMPGGKPPAGPKSPASGKRSPAAVGTPGSGKTPKLTGLDALGVEISEKDPDVSPPTISELSPRSRAQSFFRYTEVDAQDSVTYDIQQHFFEVEQILRLWTNEWRNIFGFENVAYGDAQVGNFDSQRSDRAISGYASGSSGGRPSQAENLGAPVEKGLTSKKAVEMDEQPSSSTSSPTKPRFQGFCCMKSPEKSVHTDGKRSSASTSDSGNRASANRVSLSLNRKSVEAAAVENGPRKLRVLFHCVQGINRSVALLCGTIFLLNDFQIKMQKMILQMTKIRPGILRNDKFLIEVMKLEKRCLEDKEDGRHRAALDV